MADFIQELLLMGIIVIIILIPQGMTALIFFENYAEGNKWAHNLKQLLQILISAGINIAFGLFTLNVVFQCDFPEIICKVRECRFTYQDITSLSILLTACTVFALLLGTLMRCLLAKFRNVDYGNPSLSKQKRNTILLLVSVTGIVVIASYCAKDIGTQKIVINEICSNNETTLLSQKNVCDYIEIYNTGRMPYQIEHMYLSDEIDALKKYEIPAGILEPQGYQIITIDESVPFGILNTGEKIFMSGQNGIIIDQVECAALDRDTCYCRIIDGEGPWEVRTCTPGRSNKESLPIISVPSFSCESGFYEEKFELEILGEKGVDIFYTLDGSIPSENSFHYEEPITVGDASNNANVWSMRDDVSTGFLTERINETIWFPPRYILPDYLVDKCTIIRAVCIDEEGKTGPVNSATYFVGFGNKDGYEGMNVLSVITEPDNLFDFDTGIYVRGSSYEEFDNSESPRHFWGSWEANYTQRGRLWEKEACLQFFDKNGCLFLTKNSGIRVQGGANRGRLPRSLNLYARKEYDGKNRFEADFFGTGYEPQRMTLFAGGDDNVAKLKDYLVAEVMTKRNFATLDFEPYVMFLDGEYWGYYWLTEKYDEKYFEFHYDVEADDVIMIKNNVLQLGNEEDFSLYEELKAFIINTDFSNDDNYERMCELMDVDSFIDYYATEIYIGNNDWPHNNVGLWRTRNIGNNIYSDGRWRWCLFDVNNGMLSPEEDTFAGTVERDPWLASMIASEEFCDKLTARLLDIANTEFSPENVDYFITDFIELTDEPSKKESKRFYGMDEHSVWESICIGVKEFFDERYIYITKRFGNNNKEDEHVE